MKTRKLAQGSIAVALAAVLSFIAVKAPYGGSVTAGSMVPIILFSYMYGAKWGLLASCAYSGVQMLLGFYPPPTQSFINFALVVVLDYVVAFGVLGLAGAIGKPFGKAGYAVGSGVVVILRFLSHFISGMLIWGVYAEAGQPVWLYSLTYNGGYMGCELITTVAIMIIITRSISLERLKGDMNSVGA